MWALVPSLEVLAAIFPRREVFFACVEHYCVCVRLQVGRPDEFVHGRGDSFSPGNKVVLARGTEPVATSGEHFGAAF